MRKLHPLLAILFCLTPLTAPRPAAAEDTLLHTNIERTDANLFIPDGLKMVRGVLINPADKNAEPGGVWSESCRHWGMAQLGLMLEDVDKRNNRPNTLRKVIEASLKEFADKSGHPELLNAPFLFGGMSKGGGWSAELGQGYGPRTIAFNNVCGWVGRPDRDLSMPAVIVIGGVPDGFKMLDAIPTQYEPARAKGAPWALAIQWGNAHNYGNANALAFPFLDAVIAARLPADANPAAGPVKLRDVPADQVWLGDRATWETNDATIAPWAEYRGDKAAAVWLPNHYVACAWRSFVSKDPPVQLDAASADGKRKAPPFQPRQKRFLILPPDAEVDLTAAPPSADVRPAAEVRKVTFFDGDQALGESAVAPFTFRWRHVPAGPRCVFLRYTTADGKEGVSNPVLVLTSPKAPSTSTPPGSGAGRPSVGG